MKYYSEFGGEWSLKQRWNDIEKLNDELNIFRKDDSVLDIGCAEGLVTAEVSRLVSCVTAIDTEQGRINSANKLKDRLNLLNVSFGRASITKVSITKDMYSVILCLGVLQHLPSQFLDLTLHKVFTGTRRLALFRIPKENPEIKRKVRKFTDRFTFITSISSNGSGDLIIATRKSTDEQ